MLNCHTVNLVTRCTTTKPVATGHAFEDSSGAQGELKDTAVVVQVRHISLSILRRYFREWAHMACAYDWVGSLSLIPEQFQLLDYAGKLLLPSQPVTEVKNTTLYMREAMSTPSLEDDEVTFLGFGSYEWEPTADYSLQTISETPPETLLDCDDW